jgi:tetratricopeptide (TPR) repeat protein
MTARRALAAIVVVCVAAPAEAKPTRRDLREARDHFRRGQRLHDAGRFEEAIQAYRRAYELSKLADMLYNIGQVHRMRGDREAAIEHYERYLAEAPTGPGAPKAREFLASLRREIEVETRAMRGSIDEEWRGVVQGASPDPIIPPPPTQRPPLVVPLPEEAPRDRGSGLRVAGLVAGGAGVILLAGGAVFALRAGTLSEELDALGPGDTYDPSVVEDGRAAQRNAVILLGLGTAAAVTGGVLYYLGARRASAPAVGLAPAADGGLVSFSGRF